MWGRVELCLDSHPHWWCSGGTCIIPICVRGPTQSKVLLVAHLDHFAFGPVTPVLAYVMSVVGSLLGLHCTARARASTGGTRAKWLGLAAVAIGGTGVWVMHFIAMLGFRVDGVQIRYDVVLTLVSMLVAISVVGAGLFMVGFGAGKPRALIGGGVITGLGVASMHYMGMYAMNMEGVVGYDPLLVGASIAIAVVAATVALWFTTRVRGHLVTTGAALIMGVAISGMHYTGMTAMRVTVDPSMPTPAGASAFDLLLPLIMGVSGLAVILLVTIGLSLTDEERELERQFDEQLRNRAAGLRTHVASEPVPARAEPELSWR